MTIKKMKVGSILICLNILKAFLNPAKEKIFRAIREHQ